MKKALLLAALVLGLVSTIAADIPWPVCLPCPETNSGR